MSFLGFCGAEENHVFVLYQIFRGMRRFKSLPCINSCLYEEIQVFLLRQVLCGTEATEVFVLYKILYATEEIQVFVLYQALCGTEEIQVFVLFQILCCIEEIQVFVAASPVVRVTTNKH